MKLTDSERNLVRRCCSCMGSMAAFGIGLPVITWVVIGVIGFLTGSHMTVEGQQFLMSMSAMGGLAGGAIMHIT